MIKLGTALCPAATKVMLLGSGELAKEIVIECQRLGIEVIAVDRYAKAPAMQVAHRSYVIDMQDGTALTELIQQERPHYIVPELEALATDTLLQLEQQGHKVVPCAKATQLTMDREGIRKLAAEILGLPTSAYRFANSLEELQTAALTLGFPCYIKPVMSSSGKGQSIVKSTAELAPAWLVAQSDGRAGAGRIMVESKVEFDFEITLLTVHASDGLFFCAPIGHYQKDGDYRESWQPQCLSATAQQAAQRIAAKVVTSLGGYGLFGVELFISGDKVVFSEVSPRPHDTGLVTLMSQDLSEFALHVRAFLGMPISAIRQYGPSASAVILPTLTSKNITYSCPPEVFASGVQLRLFAKPEINGRRRLGVVLASGETIASARDKARRSAKRISIEG